MTRYCIALPKPTRKPIPSLRYFIINVAFKRVLLVPKPTQYTCSTPRNVSHKYIGFHNISFETWRSIGEPYQKLRRNVIPSLGYTINTMG
jgi:hypothetical protein